MFHIPTQRFLECRQQPQDLKLLKPAASHIQGCTTFYIALSSNKSIICDAKIIYTVLVTKKFHDKDDIKNSNKSTKNIRKLRSKFHTSRPGSSSSTSVGGPGNLGSLITIRDKTPIIITPRPRMKVAVSISHPLVKTGRGAGNRTLITGAKNQCVCRYTTPQ